MVWDEYDRNDSPSYQAKYYQARKNIAALEQQKEELIRLARSVCPNSSKLEDSPNMSDSINDVEKDEESRRLPN